MDAIRITAAKQLPKEGKPLQITCLTRAGTGVYAEGDEEDGELHFSAYPAFAAFVSTPGDVIVEDGSRVPMGVVNRAVLHGFLDMWIDRTLADYCQRTDLIDRTLADYCQRTDLNA
jgi:hypothetical protein